MHTHVKREKHYFEKNFELFTSSSIGWISWTNGKILLPYQKHYFSWLPYIVACHKKKKENRCLFCWIQVELSLLGPGDKGIENQCKSSQKYPKIKFDLSYHPKQSVHDPWEMQILASLWTSLHKKLNCSCLISMFKLNNRSLKYKMEHSTYSLCKSWQSVVGASDWLKICFLFKGVESCSWWKFLDHGIDDCIRYSLGLVFWNPAKTECFRSSLSLSFQYTSCCKVCRKQGWWSLC